MKKSTLNKKVKICLLSVIAFLLMFIELSIPIFPDFLKIDISDLPALIGTFAFGPSSGVVIELFKNVLHGLFGSKSMFIGEFANFLIGSVLVITSGAIYEKIKTKKGAVISMIVGTVTMSISAGLINYFILLPLYQKVLGVPINLIVLGSSKINPHIVDLKTLIFWAIIPFNLLKGIIICVVTRVVYKGLSPVLHKEQNEIKLLNKCKNQYER